MGQALAKEVKHREQGGSNTPVGEILRRTRLYYKQTIPDIERALRIKVAQIEAIESGRYEKLPGRTYTIGFIRTYAEYLGLDGNKIVEMFKAQSGIPAMKPELSYSASRATAPDAATPGLKLAGGAVLAALAVVILWSSMNGGDRAIVTEIPPVPETMKQEQAQPPSGSSPPPAASASDPASNLPVTPAPGIQEPLAGTQAAPLQPSTEAATTSAQQGIILNIRQNSWVEIKDSEGKTIVSRVLKAGDKYFVPDRPDLFMSIGNSGGVGVQIGGEDLAPLGQRGQILKNVPLDAAALRKKYAPKGAKKQQ